MNTEADILQERLEQLERGQNPDVCVTGMSDDAAELVRLAAKLRTLDYQVCPTPVVAAQRTAVLKYATAAPASPPMKQKKATLLEKLFGGKALPRPLAIGLGACVVLLMALGLVWGARWLKPSGEEIAAVISTPDSAVLPQPDSPVVQTPTEGVTAEQYLAFLPTIISTLEWNAERGVVQDIRGVVEIQSSDGDWQLVHNISTFGAGEAIRTGALSSARLAFFDGSQVTLGPQTELIMEMVNAPETGPREIVLIQPLGESRHEVASNGNTASRYEVHTPAATGIAQGTVFEVQVTADQRAQFSVEEGAVMVANAAANVLVEAGQLTTAAVDDDPAPPAFRITGEGQVTEIGETWVVAGQTFQTHAQTVIIGNPQVGDWVLVEGRLLPDDTRVADRIVLLQRAPTNRFTLSGKVETMGDTWTVAGQTINVVEETIIDADIVVGDLVEVRGIILTGGAFQAETITRLEQALGLPFSFTGVVQVVGADTWMISGVTIAVDADTTLAADLEAGELVAVRGYILADGRWLATDITRALAEPNFSFTGVLESMAPWRVAGITFEVRSWTLIADDLAIGDRVRVTGRVLDDGTWVAHEITLLADETGLYLTLIGTVESISPWVVSGFHLNVTAETEIIGTIEVGTLVKVAIHVLPDGTWKVVRIAPLSIEQNLGCFNLTAVVISANATHIQLAGWPLLPLGENVLLDEILRPGTVVQFRVCMTEDGRLEIVYIVIVHSPTPSPAQPPTTGEKWVTICHKPDKKKGGQTMTLPESAIPGHLGHGDTLGPCP